VPILKMRASPVLLPGAIVAMTGVFLATTQNQPLSWHSFWRNLTQHSAPYILGATAGVSWALYSTLSRKWASDALAAAVPLFMLCTGIVLGLARLCLPEDTHWTRRALYELSYLAVGSNLAYLFWERAVRRGDIVFVASCSYFTPLLSTLASTLYLGIVAGARLWIGCGLVIAGAIVCKLAIKERSIPTTEPAKERMNPHYDTP
jgi:drug/metabolite transporter (DMT)-like permease